MARFLLAVFLGTMLLVSNPATASDYGILFGGWSYHLDRDREYNESHRMVGVSYKNLSLVYFRNSYDKVSWGLGYSTDPVVEYKGFEVGGYIAAWTGYKDQGWSIAMPVIAPYIRKDFGPVRATVMTVIEVTTFNLEWRF